MKKLSILTSVLAAGLVLTSPFVGAGGSGFSGSTGTAAISAAPSLAPVTVPAAPHVVAAPRVIIAKTTRAGATIATLVGPQGQACPTVASGTIGLAPGITSAGGVAGTTSNDLASFAYKYNAIRIANCLEPIPYGNFRYNSCMEARLFWMAESPSPSVLDAWGHIGSVRIDGVPSTGCDGNLAGGSGNTGATVAQKWWNSSSHRASLYRPGTSIAGVCIAFALTHGGIDEPYSFTRSAARWTTC